MRPVFDGILGHDALLDGLRRAQDSGRVAHAWLFAGPDGVGKRRVAEGFAKRLNCLKRADGGDGCGLCRTCRQFAAGTHPDYVVVEPDGQFIKIAQIREVTRGMRFPPVDAATRVIRIDQAERLHEAAANSLLKTLEEPAARNVFLLLTSQPNAVLATIRSRCQLARFGALPREVVSSWLEREKGLDSVTADEVAGLAAGSLANAEQLTNPTAGALREEWLRQLGQIPKLGPIALMEAADAMSAEKESLPAVLDVLRIGLRDALLIACGAREDQLALRRRRIAITADPEALVKALQLVGDAEVAAARNVNPRMVAEHVLLGLRGLLTSPA
jgi:DNA polymerase-3 subunit delta'